MEILLLIWNSCTYVDLLEVQESTCMYILFLNKKAWETKQKKNPRNLYFEFGALVNSGKLILNQNIKHQSDDVCSHVPPMR